MEIYESNSIKDTEEVAKIIAKSLKCGDVVALNGDLGVGKTELVKGISKFLGYHEDVVSPTFALVNEYDGDIPIYHFDAYRLEGQTLDGCIWMDDYLFGEGICIIEWAENVSFILPKSAITINITKDLEVGEDYRKITVE
ncbi:MAG: tRNA (adenosine(37)-N6)-threonylcarbamoyltransferase complex ATPase subunit type 1 TsaE [Oscillospiraceae bacterium]